MATAVVPTDAPPQKKQRPQEPPTSGVAVMNEDCIAGLEEFFLFEAQEDTFTSIFDLPVALSILRLYNFFPRRLREDVVLHILGMALGEAPHEAVFLSCRYILPDAVRDTPAVQQLCVLSELLDTAHYKAFWILWDALPAAPWKHDGLALKVRLAILETVARVYDTIRLELLGELLHLAGPPLTSLLEGRKCSVSRGVVKINRGEFQNQSLSAAQQPTGPSIPPLSAMARVLETVAVRDS
eukprot:TRINITY_DN3544_c0_g1_i1.p1 TRINITY_DN3544_c0_g1~~TRINITY_DN3544_c0_g1_i1.p1  ORF type:complete len:240 (-),score=52.33 TRINITY_DN3544_c0_g1_i1:258-977(-)